MHALDASSIIYAWDNYPFAQFPKLWVWLGKQISDGVLEISAIASSEVQGKSPDCHAWMKSQGAKPHDIDNSIVQQALAIKSALSIVNDAYHSKGVGENDIFIIAASKIRNRTLVTNEARQLGKQQVLAKLKIPGVCDLPSIKVEHCSFLEYIVKSLVVF